MKEIWDTCSIKSFYKYPFGEMEGGNRSDVSDLLLSMIRKSYLGKDIDFPVQQ